MTDFVMAVGATFPLVIVFGLLFRAAWLFDSTDGEKKEKHT